MVEGLIFLRSLSIIALPKNPLCSQSLRVNPLKSSLDYPQPQGGWPLGGLVPCNDRLPSSTEKLHPSGYRSRISILWQYLLLVARMRFGRVRIR